MLRYYEKSLPLEGLSPRPGNVSALADTDSDKG